MQTKPKSLTRWSVEWKWKPSVYKAMCPLHKDASRLV
jgi:hypothetical protein